MRNFVPMLLFLAACDRGPEVPTAAENRDLDEAARMLDDAEGNLSAIDEGAIRPDEAGQNR